MCVSGWICLAVPSLARCSQRRLRLASAVAGGGDVDRLAYDPLLSRLASFGFVVASPRQCSMGCLEDCKTLDGDPPCFGRYYHQQLDVFSWARNYSSADSRNVSGSPADVLSRVNHSMGYGVAGHSMGGQATLFSSSFHNASEQHIKAAVMHHAFSRSQSPAPAVPFLAFTGEKDDIARPKWTRKFFDAPLHGNASVPKGLVDRSDTDHLEPLFWFNDKALALFTAAWFKLYVVGVRASDGVDWEEVIYGNSTDSLCGGGDGSADEMKECLVKR